MSPAGPNRSRGGPWPALVLWLLALAVLLPFAEMVWTAQKPRERVNESYRYLYVTRRLPEPEVRRKIEIAPRPLRVSLVNSAIVSSVCAVLGVALALPAGYAFAKRQFRGKQFTFDLVIVSMSVPAAILMTPLFDLVIGLGIYDTRLALILPFAVSGFGIFYMRHVIASVPDDLIDAGRVDGLSHLGVLRQVVLPTVWPSVVTLGVVEFITSWGSFVLPHALIASPENYTVAVLLGRLMADYGGLMWNDVMFVVAAALLPVFLIFLVFNRWIIGRLTPLAEERRERE